MFLRNQIVESTSTRLSQFLVRRKLEKKNFKTQLLEAILDWLALLNSHQIDQKFSEIEILRLQLQAGNNTHLKENFNEAEIKWIMEASHWGRSSQWSALHYSLCQRLQPRKCLEIGTCLGLSAAYLGSALKSQGSVHTFEINKTLSRAANLVLNSLKQTNVQVYNQFRLEDFASFIEMNADIDFVFLDGDHRKETTTAILDLICDSIKHEALILIDDIRWSDEMAAVWKEFKKRPQVTDTVDLNQMGLGVINRRGAGRSALRLPLFLH